MSLSGIQNTLEVEMAIDWDKVVITSDEGTVYANCGKAIVFAVTRTGSGSGNAIWGEITGTLTAQTDLKNALDAKANTADLGDMADVNDAPSDGKTYGRKNGAWSEAATDSAVWGSITGTLSNQTDLKNALDGKSDAIEDYDTSNDSGLLANYFSLAQGSLFTKAHFERTPSLLSSAFWKTAFIYLINSKSTTPKLFTDGTKAMTIYIGAVSGYFYGGTVDLVYNRQIPSKSYIVLTLPYEHIDSYAGNVLPSGSFWYGSDYSIGTYPDDVPEIGTEVVYTARVPKKVVFGLDPTYFTGNSDASHYIGLADGMDMQEYFHWLMTDMTWTETDGTDEVKDPADYIAEKDVESQNYVIAKIESELGSMAYVDDAASDSKTYGRKNGAWIEVTGGGGGSVSWGSISGTLSDQVDLQTALNAKANTSSLGTMASVNDASSDNKIYGRKNGTWAEVTGGGGGSAEWGDITGTLSDQTDLQNALNEKAASISIAEEFSPTKSYPAGWNYAVYHGILYKFTGPYQGPFSGLHNYTTVSVFELLALKAPLDSPALSGTPTAPTASTGTNTTQIATTAFVQGEISGKADTADLGDLAYQDTVDYDTEVTNKPTLGTMAAVDDAPSNGSEYVRKNGAWAVSSGITGVDWGDIGGTLADQTDLKNALDGKEDTLTFDSTPTSGSSNPVTSDGIYDALANKADTSSLGDLATQDTVDYTTEVTNKPTLGALAGMSSIDYTSNYLTNKPTLGALADQDTVDYDTEVTNKPTLGTMAAQNDAASDDVYYLRRNGSWTDADGRYYTETEIDTSLALKAPLASPALTGTPTAPTATVSDDSTQIATTAFVQDHVPISLSVTASAGSTVTKSDARITATMRVINCVFGTPANVTSDLSWTTSAGSVTFTGTFTGSTTITFELIECN